MAINTSKLHAAVLFLVLLTQAIQACPTHAPPVSAAIQDMKKITQELFDFLMKETKHALDEHKGPYTIGCISEPNETNNDFLDCKLFLTFDAYFTEAIALDIQSHLTDGLKAIKQHIQSFIHKKCKSETLLKACMKAFEKKDDDYMKLSRVRSLVVLFKKWLGRPILCQSY